MTRGYLLGTAGAGIFRLIAPCISHSSTALLIVVSALEKIDCFIGDTAHQAVFLSDAPGPTTAEHIFEWFGFSGSFKGIPHDRVNEIEDSHRDRAFVLDPKSKILKKLGLKYRDAFSLPLHQASLAASRSLSRA